MSVMDSLWDNELSPQKIWTQYNKLMLLAQGADVCPTTLELDVFSGCNHHCRWCVDPAGSHDNVLMSRDTAEAVIRDAYALGVRGLVFKGGGEPAMHPEFAGILRMARAAGFEAGAVTNGTNLRQLSEVYLETLDYVRISVDGATPQARLEIHGAADFDELKDAIGSLTARRRGRHPVIGLSFCMEYAHIDTIPQAIELGEGQGVDYVLLRPVFGGEVGYEPSHTPAEAALLRAEIARQAAGYKGRVRIIAGDWKGDSEFEESGENYDYLTLSRRDALIQNRRYNGIEHLTGRCPAAGLLLVIAADLSVYFCC